MNVFEFRTRLTSDYEAFSRSFCTVKTADMVEFIDRTYADQHFWPSPLIQLNPCYVPGKAIDQLVRDGVLHPECEAIFRRGKEGGNLGVPLLLHKHQQDAVHIAQRRESYVLTTGTGSGKSLSYFIPIVDHVLRQNEAGQNRARIKAIVIYPMNALCNSQLEELQKFLTEGYGLGNEKVTYGRYTGQESQEERERLVANPPDILLTNFMMLELLMTRQEELDKGIVRAAQGLEFLVLDELHTYRGRQGADVAILVRRVRESLNKNLLCIGTSATMASEGESEDRKSTVARIASRLFGAPVKAENVITETLQRVTVGQTEPDVALLCKSLEQGLGDIKDFELLRAHPLAPWVELNLGLAREGESWVRARPQSINEAVQKLYELTGVNQERCEDVLRDFLLKAYQARGLDGKSLFAFRLHQFVSGAGDLYSTLEPPGQRYLTVNGQQFKPGDRDKRLFNATFCRQCGQEYFPVWAQFEGGQIEKIEPRSLDDRAHEDEDIQPGLFFPDADALWDDADPEKAFPEDWLDFSKEPPRLKSHFRRYKPVYVKVNPAGDTYDGGMRGWYLPGSLRFCLNPDCGHLYESQLRDRSKLSSLSTEGRSSATTIMALSVMRYLLEEEQELPDQAKKLLGFTDNRQDASLQAGHFNDFVMVLLLRGALLAAVKKNPSGITDETLTQLVAGQLDLSKHEFMANPDAEFLAERKAQQALRDVLGYRLFYDLRRGWRIVNPNLEQLGLLKIGYQYLTEACQAEELWSGCHPLLANATPEIRERVLTELLDTLRRALCIKTPYLDQFRQEQIKVASFAHLREPWGLNEDERMQEGGYMFPFPKSRWPHKDPLANFVSYRSRFGFFLKKRSTWGEQAQDFPDRLPETLYNQLVAEMLQGLTRAGLVEPLEIEGQKAFRLNGNALMWTFDPDGEADQQDSRRTENRFFRNLYLGIATSLLQQERFLHKLEAREHTAQVDSDEREKREELFRKAELPVLFCSPTMELGVDIAELNTVYMRNVPPTPANYAQRSGRAGRSGQPALVITYCAAQSPHDQYFFSDPVRMVSGIVRPPTLDLANEELVRSHLHAVWLAETGQKLDSSINGLLDLADGKNLPILSHIKANLDHPGARQRTLARGQRILEMLQDELTTEAAPWFASGWLERTIQGACQGLHHALERWRSLYQATVRQMESSHAVLLNAAAAEGDRKRARQRYREAQIQQELLLHGRATMNSDFYTYRYLASQGFIPGYNFPRLPLMAFIPARREKGPRDSFLTRPRFLALSEFGPQSRIYHEGSQYLVHKLIIATREDERASEDIGLPVHTARLCPNCGYGHFGSQFDDPRCRACDTLLEGGLLLDKLYRVEHVSTRRVTQITSDEEERLRMGYEMQTTLQYALEEGRLQVVRTTFTERDKDLVEIHYGPAATVWRINLGWRRRRNASIYGFNIDVSTGVWSKDDQAPPDDEVESEEARNVLRIVPFVEDRRNVMVLFPRQELSEGEIASLQYALKRGVESVFQLEESELMAEPLPTRLNRQAILFYESAEGGAGVLTRLASDSGALQRVARAALEVCHYDIVGNSWQEEWQGQVLVDTAGPESAEACEAGCYRCLLSYYNQPDHDLLDRRNPRVLELLFRLMHSIPQRGTEGRKGDAQFDELMRLSGSSLEQRWLQTVREKGLRLPDRAQPLLEAFNTRPDFGYPEHQAVIYIDGPHHESGPQRRLDDDLTQRLSAAGLTVVRFPKEQAKWSAIFAQYPDIFGSGA
ncbi:DEAD/DEAH box helicase [Geobacter sp.]|uniref:DEAD/DEAH box helicase n=1 Tax=Geobacter sp. TaxID=46610 RepID=UPI0027BAD9C5|nr:DEAD/DEAH box helicase [Geobacter sp.]